MLIRYQWSEDGEVELVDMKKVILEQAEVCYHCDRLMLSGDAAVKLINKNGETYLLHETCARSSCVKRGE